MMFLETQLDRSLSSERSEIRFMREFLSNFGPVELVAREVHSRVDLEKFLEHARADRHIQALHIVSHGGGKAHPSSIVLTEDEVVDLRRRDGWRLFEDLSVEVIFLSCCRLGLDRPLMEKLRDASGAVAVVALAVWLEPDEPAPATTGPVPFAQVQAVIAQRCATCHSGASAPLGIRLETEAEITARADDIERQAVQTRAMPPANATGMTEAERELLAGWLAQR